MKSELHSAFQSFVGKSTCLTMPLEVLLFAVSSPITIASATNPPDLLQLEQAAPLIVKARVSDLKLLRTIQTRPTEQAGTRLSGSLLAADCKAVYAIKGNMPLDRFQVEFTLGAFSGPTVIIRPGKTYLLFLKRDGERYVFVNDDMSALQADAALPPEAPRGSTVRERLQAEMAAWLCSTDPEVVVQALEFLPETICSTDVGSRIRDLGDSKDRGVRAAAVRALLRTGNPDGVPSAIALLQQEPASTEQARPERAQVVDQLSRVRDPGATRALLPLMRHSDPSVRRSVADALRRARQRSFVPHLVAGLSDVDSRTRYRCMMGLAEVLDRMNPEWTTSLARFPERGDELIGRWLHWWETEGKRIDWEAAPPATQTSQPLGR